MIKLTTQEQKALTILKDMKFLIKKNSNDVLKILILKIFLLHINGV